MKNVNIKQTRSNDGAKIVATIEAYEDEFLPGIMNLRGCQTLKIVINRFKRVVTVVYVRNFLKMRPAENLVVPLEEISTSEGLIYNHVLQLVDHISEGVINSSKWLEDLIKSSSR